MRNHSAGDADRLCVGTAAILHAVVSALLAAIGERIPPHRDAPSRLRAAWPVLSVAAAFGNGVGVAFVAAPPKHGQPVVAGHAAALP
jgi:hypothetical protein